jgi:hypothetical protein
MCFAPYRAFLALAAAALVAVGCSRSTPAAASKPDQALDTALFPATWAASLQAAGGGHFHATTRLRADVARKASPDDGSQPASPAEATTTTDLWVDPQGSFRLLEENDQDGGREIVRVGGEVAVALRYGKMMRRQERDIESARFLAEALGGPWAAWELVRRQVRVEDAGQGSLRFGLADRARALPAGFPPPQGLRKWRDSVLVKSLTGQAALDARGKLPLAFACRAAFLATRDDVPIAGEIEVDAKLTDVGQVARLALPDAGTLPMRQRTVLEERALLGGLPAAANVGRGRASP